MLERYIEKCVIRQVYLCEQLYEKESVLIDRLAEQLDVCPATIINDIDKILLLLKNALLPPLTRSIHIKWFYCRIFLIRAYSNHLSRILFLQVLYQF